MGLDVDYLNELKREKAEDKRFNKFYSDVIDLLKFRSENN